MNCVFVVSGSTHFAVIWDARCWPKTWARLVSLWCTLRSVFLTFKYIKYWFSRSFQWKKHDCPATEVKGAAQPGGLHHHTRHAAECERGTAEHLTSVSSLEVSSRLWFVSCREHHYQSSWSEVTWTPAPVWSRDLWPASWWWRIQRSSSKALSCSWSEWRRVVRNTRDLTAHQIMLGGRADWIVFCLNRTLFLCVLRLCGGIRQRRHRNTEHSDRWRWCLSRSLHPHLYGFSTTLHLSHAWNHQL